MIDDEVQTVRVLYVEDDADTAELVRRLLERDRTLRVEVAARLLTALEIVAVRPPDLIMLDLVLPDSPAAETLPRMIERAALVPVVVVSGLGDEEEMARRALLSGAIGYLPKPIFTERQNSKMVAKKLIEWAALGRLRRGVVGPIQEEIRAVQQRLERIEQVAYELRCSHAPGCGHYAPIVGQVG